LNNKYRLTKFDESEMKIVFQDLNKERAAWRNIQDRKKLLVHMTQPYSEPIYTNLNLKITKKSSEIER
jgi:hypothetical protein